MTHEFNVGDRVTVVGAEGLVWRWLGKRGSIVNIVLSTPRGHPDYLVDIDGSDARWFMERNVQAVDAVTRLGDLA